jgi:hypothetical protein
MVPLITPVLVLRDIPPGNAPDATEYDVESVAVTEKL